MKQLRQETITIERMVGGGQAIGTLASGKKVFVWGALPGELVEIQIQKEKSKYAEALTLQVLHPSPLRIQPRDPDSYLSTSPWQIVHFGDEQIMKAQLIAEAYELHHLSLPGEIDIYSDHKQYEYRNKVEFSWWWDNEKEQLDLAFYRRGTKGKIPVEETSLAQPPITVLARAIRNLLRTKSIEARSLKTLLLRTTASGNVVWQLYVKDHIPDIISADEAAALPALGGEIIFSDPRSPASRITERLAKFGNCELTDSIVGVPFSYAAESFFQVNLPVYEQALSDMRVHLLSGPVIDMYCGVGSIGLSVADGDLTVVESDKQAYKELERNIQALNRQASTTAICAPSEEALSVLTPNASVIVDPPRAGLHKEVVERLRNVKPKQILYLSCNPVTQARDIEHLQIAYNITFHRGYNFFPRTPHIEHLVVLTLRS